MYEAASVTTLCSTLGDDQPSLLDQDIFGFTGTRGETVTLTLEADPTGAQTGVPPGGARCSATRTGRAG